MKLVIICCHLYPICLSSLFLCSLRVFSSDLCVQGKMGISHRKGDWYFLVSRLILSLSLNLYISEVCSYLCDTLDSHFHRLEIRDFLVHSVTSLL